MGPTAAHLDSHRTEAAGGQGSASGRPRSVPLLEDIAEESLTLVSNTTHSLLFTSLSTFSHAHLKPVGYKLIE